MRYTAHQHLMAARFVRQNLLRRGHPPGEANRRAGTFVTLAMMAARREAGERTARSTPPKGPTSRATHGRPPEPPVLPPEIFGTPGEYGAAQLLAHSRIAALHLPQTNAPAARDVGPRPPDMRWAR
jgi:hypothetical protein